MNNYLQHIYSMRWALCAGCVDLYVYLVLKSAPKQHLDISIAELSKNLYTSANSIKKYRDKLVLAGLVSYDTGTPQQVCSTFTIIPVTTSNFDAVNAPTTSNFDAVNAPTTSNFDAVNVPTASKFDAVNVPTTSNFDAVNAPTTSNFDAVTKNSANKLNETISNFDTVRKLSNSSSDFAIIWSEKEGKKEKLSTSNISTSKLSVIKKTPKCGFLFGVAYPTVSDFILPIQKLVPSMDIDEVSYWYNQAKAWSDENCAKKPKWAVAVSNWKTNNPYQYQEYLQKQAKQQYNDKTGIVAGSSANKELIMKADFEVNDLLNKISKLKIEVEKLNVMYEKYPNDRQTFKVRLKGLLEDQDRLHYNLGLAQFRRQKLD